MTHDPLCPHDYVPYKQLGPNSCTCDLIAKVRDDELRRLTDDAYMSLRAVSEWDERIRVDEREESIRRVTALWNRTTEDEGGTPLLSDVKRVIRGDKS